MVIRKINNNNKIAGKYSSRSEVRYVLLNNKGSEDLILGK